ncbi:MAG: hypothetical protein CMJ89_18240 [Planctomycetes bacterium]|nr:hypothetical protein [Planctomycetota bacterium]
MDFPGPWIRNQALVIAFPLIETEATPLVAALFFGVFGLVVGSFLNVAIYRLPKEGMSVWRPLRSHCPRCAHELAWYENVPVLSWVIQGARCRSCRGTISARYPLVELLTGALWALAAWMAPSVSLALVHVLILSGLIVATFVDLDCFEIPDEVSIGGMVVAPLLSFLLPEIHAETWIASQLSTPAEGGTVDAGGAFLASLTGMAAGGGVLLWIGWLGKKLFGRDAMGLGDVKLLAAAGGFIGPGGVLMALFIGSLLASVSGVLNIARFFCLIRLRARVRKARKNALRTLQAARIAGRYLPFGPYLSLGVGIVLVDWKDVVQLLERFVF